MSPRSEKLIVFLLAAAAHIIALLRFNLKVGAVTLPVAWKADYFLLLFISLAVALVLPFLRNLVLIWVLLITRGAILWVIAFPGGGCYEGELTLFASLILETMEYTRIWPGLLFVMALSGVGLDLKCHSVIAWGKMIAPPMKNDLFFGGVFAGFIIVFSLVLRYQREHTIAKKEMNVHINASTLQLAQVNMQLQEFAASAEQAAILGERKRLTRDFHDTIGYTLTNILMLNEVAKGMTSPEQIELRDELERARGQIKDGLTEVRRVLQALRPEPLNEVTGLAAINRLVTAFAKATQIEVVLELGNAPLHFGEEAELVVYRFIQEGLTNALRHGRATRIDVSFTLSKNRLFISVKDNGTGAIEIGEGYGLAGMNERIEQLGGKLEIFNSPGNGFKLMAAVPLKEVG